MIDLRPGTPWVRDYDRAAWQRAWRKAADLPPGDYPDPYGLPRLREALADHLRRTRAVPVGPENILVTRGTGNGLDLVPPTLLRPGDRAGVEDPGYRVARTRLRRPGSGGRALPGGRGRRDRRRAPRRPACRSTPRPRTSTRSAGGCRSRAGNGCSPGPAVPARSSWRTTTTPSSATTSPRCPPSTVSTRPAWCCSARCRSRWRPTSASAGWSPRRSCSTGSPPSGDDAGRPHQRPGPAGRGGAPGARRPGPAPAPDAAGVRPAPRRRSSTCSASAGCAGDTAGLHVLVELPAAAVRAAGRAPPASAGVLLDSIERHHHGPTRLHGLVIGYGSASLTEVRTGCEVVAELIADRERSARHGRRRPERADHRQGAVGVQRVDGQDVPGPPAGGLRVG